MNVHDSERLAGLLESSGYVKADVDEQADVVVFNTCAVRENADNKLYGNLGMLYRSSRRNPGMQIAVGGCLAQKDRGEIARRAPWVDVVFGTHNIGALPVLLERARHRRRGAGRDPRVARGLSRRPCRRGASRSTPRGSPSASDATTPARSASCRALRGTEKDRRPGDILLEIETLVADGVIEVTLLGQNVNSYGVEFGDRSAFSKLLRACGSIDGLERVRFTSPHPRDFTDDVIAAMAKRRT